MLNRDQGIVIKDGSRLNKLIRKNLTKLEAKE